MTVWHNFSDFSQDAPLVRALRENAVSGWEAVDDERSLLVLRQRTSGTKANTKAAPTNAKAAANIGGKAAVKNGWAAAKKNGGKTGTKKNGAKKNGTKNGG
ncbi:unnamed protein product [Aphanomyces euteiches]